MLTPRFKLTQDDSHVYINVHAPYTNVGDTEIDVDGENFLFVSSPYFLRLRLPGRIVDNERSKGSYICDSGEFNLTFDKESIGEQFENLDMITSLLAPRDIPDINPNLVEMLEEDGITLENDNECSTENKYSYGFANKISTEFSNIGIEFPQIFELKAPESITVEERSELRIKHENSKFSSDHYLADFFDDELLEPYLSLSPAWDTPDFNKEVQFSDEEVGILKDLPNKHYLLTKTEYKAVVFGLVDIMYGYCYDKRTTLNESTVESSWTINKLSSTMSWFCTFKDLKETLTTCYRRALIYPIFRNFKLCHKVKNDLISLLRQGKKFVIKCMIEIHQMFNTSNDARYILNQLYIKDYLVFLQKCRNEEIDELCNNIVNIDVFKNDLSLELIELEAAAQMVQQEETEIMENEMAVKMASMNLLPSSRRKGPYIDESDETDSSSDSSSGSDSSELDSDDDDPS
ncbi:Protein SHQ1-like protein [Operophtera brumata]|uniref:Protein SHQ1 homolog n=1 Tax=Operophtera brumata TaxID=104452 RepID=A0A0L7KMF6_OPEBR|nr:Protein SHQ1-like protein [Operophtera brumata]